MKIIAIEMKIVLSQKIAVGTVATVFTYVRPKIVGPKICELEVKRLF